jgi:hypothetical protein
MSVTEAEPCSSPAEPVQQLVDADRLYYFHRYKLQTYFQKYNPSKLDDVDALLEAYDGEEETLFRALEKKYSVDSPCEEFSLSYAAYEAMILEATADDPVGDFDDEQHASSGIDQCEKSGPAMPSEEVGGETVAAVIAQPEPNCSKEFGEAGRTETVVPVDAETVIPPAEPDRTETFSKQPPDSSGEPSAARPEGVNPTTAVTQPNQTKGDEQPSKSLKEMDPLDSHPKVEEEDVSLPSSNNEVTEKSSVERSPSEATEQSPSPSRRQPHLTVSVHRSQEPVRSRVPSYAYVVELKCDKSIPEVSLLGSARTATPTTLPPPVAHPTTVKHSTYTCATKKLSTTSATKGARGYSSGPGVSATLQQMWRLTQL